MAEKTSGTLLYVPIIFGTYRLPLGVAKIRYVMHSYVLKVFLSYTRRNIPSGVVFSDYLPFIRTA